MSKLCGKWPTVRPCSAAARPRGRARTCRRAPRRPPTPRRRRRCPASAVRSSTTPPKTGTDAPHTPLRPPAAVTGTRAGCTRRRTAATSSVVVGRHDRAGAPRHLAGQRPVHRQRPPVATGLGTSPSSVIVSQIGVQPVEQRPSERCDGSATEALPVPVSSIGGVGSVMRPVVRSPCRARVSSRRAAGRQPSARARRAHGADAELGDLRSTSASSQPSSRGDQRGDRRARPRRVAARSNRRARVRRDSTSSSVIAISWRTA